MSFHVSKIANPKYSDEIKQMVLENEEEIIEKFYGDNIY